MTLAERLSALFGSLSDAVDEVEDLESKLRRLDVQLAESTPEAYCSRVARRLLCAGEMALLENVMRTALQDGGAVVHSVDRAPARRFLTLLDVMDPVQPTSQSTECLPEHENTNRTTTITDLTRKYGSCDSAIARVRSMEEECAKKELRLAEHSPDEMVARVKQNLAWLGDLSLLRDALDNTQAFPRKSTPYRAGSQACRNVRQLVLIEVDTSSDARVVEVEEPAIKNGCARIKHEQATLPRVRKRVQQKKLAATMEQSSDEDQEELKRPRTRSMSLTGFWPC